ncbi:hypothetical protein D3C87_904050 [compost metagenome]
MVDPDGRRGGAGLRALHDVLADGRVGLVLLVEDVGSVDGEELADPLIAEDEGSGGVGRVAELVGVDRDGVGFRKGFEAGGRSPIVRPLDPLALGIAETRRRITAIGAIDMAIEIHSQAGGGAFDLHEPVDLVHRAGFGRAQHRYQAQDGDFAGGEILEHGAEGLGVDPVVFVEGEFDDLFAASSEEIHGLDPGVVLGGGDQEDRFGEGGVEGALEGPVEAEHAP